MEEEWLQRALLEGFFYPSSTLISDPRNLGSLAVGAHWGHHGYRIDSGKKHKWYKD